MVYDVYEEDKEKDENLNHVLTAMRLLQGDYIGGHGTRGYGKVSFENVIFTERTVADFYSKNEGEATPLDNYKL